MSDTDVFALILMLEVDDKNPLAFRIYAPCLDERKAIPIPSPLPGFAYPRHLILERLGTLFPSFSRDRTHDEYFFLERRTKLGGVASVCQIRNRPKWRCDRDALAGWRKAQSLIYVAALH